MVWGFIVTVLSLLVSSVLGTKLFIATAIVCMICPILDGNVIGPKIYGKSNKLHPLLVIFAVFAGGIVAGFWGIVISIPVAIILKVTYNFYKKDINRRIVKIKRGVKMKKLKYLIFVLLLFPVSVLAGSKYVYIDDDVSINEEVGNSAVAFGGTVNVNNKIDGLGAFLERQLTIILIVII